MKMEFSLNKFQAVLWLSLVMLITVVTGAAETDQQLKPLPPGATLSTNALPVSTDRHIIGPGDVIELKVYQEDELSSRARVDTDGSVNLPLLGNIKLAGKSIQDAIGTIRDLLQEDYIYNPQVALSVVDFAKRRFAVLGQVSKPGYYEIPSNETVNLLQAIATAGGYTRIADPSKINVKRMVNGKEEVFRLNAKQMANEKDSRVFEVLADDTITVAESKF